MCTRSRARGMNVEGVNLVLKLLTFRITKAELDGFDNRHLAIAFIATWIVGFGRWWDDPKAELLQTSGLGSVAYIIVLSFVIFCVVWPLEVPGWRYRHVLTFVGLTAPPAILYAIPVERFMPMEVAAQVNLAFLLLVAVWRVALLLFYLSRFGQLAAWKVAVSSLLPLSAIVIALSFLNLTRGVVQIMGGLRDKSADDLANGVVVGLGFFAYVLFIPLLIAYIAAIVIARRQRKLQGRLPDVDRDAA